MKKSILSLAVLTMVAGLAHAQSNVQVYGLIDAGVEHVNHANAAQGGATRVISGGKNTSRWGFKGTEDLGGGLKAVWGLEGGILMDTGAADGAMFKRQAFVGLEGGYGRLVIGRSFTTTYDFLIGVDPLGFAPNYSWSTSGGATGPSKYGMTTAFDTLIKYSGSAGEFKYGATIGLGEQAGNSTDSRKYAVAGSWTHDGLLIMTSYEEVNGNLLAATGKRDVTTVYHLAADYKTGPWRVSGGLRGYKLEAGKAATPDVRGDTLFGGVSYKTASDITLTGAVYHVDVKNVAAGKDADPTMVVLRAMKALSKRTDLYVAAAHASAKNGQLVGLSRDDPGFASTQTGLTAGIQHRF